MTTTTAYTVHIDKRALDPTNSATIWARLDNSGPWFHVDQPVTDVTRANLRGVLHGIVVNYVGRSALEAPSAPCPLCTRQAFLQLDDRCHVWTAVDVTRITRVEGWAVIRCTSAACVQQAKVMVDGAHATAQAAIDAERKFSTTTVVLQ